MVITGNLVLLTHAIDPEVRWKGSSGGTLTAVLVSLLERKKISGVLQVGCDKNNPLKNCVFFSQSVDQLIYCCGSRYGPSSLLENINEILNTDGQIAIVGKPCDIAALNQYLEIRPELKSKVFCMLSFFCMGLPSYRSTEKLLSHLGVSHDKVKEFRYRGCGWPGKAVAITDEGKYEASYEESWSNILGRELKTRCKLCPDGMGEFADIVLGDAWYLQDNKPVFEEKPGRSVLFTRSDIGDAAVNEAISNDYLFLNKEEADIGKMKYIQPSQYGRKLCLLPKLTAAWVCGGRYRLKL